MSNKHSNQAYTPDWIKKHITETQKQGRVENEVKFVLPIRILSEIKKKNNPKIKKIDQIYLEQDIVNKFIEDLFLPKEILFNEFRIRQKGNDYFFTAKGPARNDGIQRDEYEKDIDNILFENIKQESNREKKLKRVKKTRYIFKTIFAQEEVTVEIDDYHVTGKGKHSYDYITCEVEVPNLRLAQILQKDRFFAPDLLFIKLGFNVTGINQFSNRYLAENGFIANSYLGIKKWLLTIHSTTVQSALRTISEGYYQEGIEKAKESLKKIELINNKKSIEVSTSDIRLTQDILADIKFKAIDSKGRKNTNDQHLNKMDSLGKGWLHDYHTILSTTAYLRLNYKPQIFRPGGIGFVYSDTTTRGAHTSDVIASAMQLSKQMGLNMELCMASAAMHDIGHPAGGHVGEKVLFELSGKAFEHHIFSLSLAEMFGLNLLREVLLGSLYHKTKGGVLETPKGMPEEFGVIRLADKLSYCPWDFFDSINNGYLSKQSKNVQDVINILGEKPMDWILNLTNVAVRESSEAHQVRFTEKSGDIYYAYKEAVNIVREEVHHNINWDSLRSQIALCYHTFEESFPNIDPVPAIAYITDTELIQLSGLIESRPKNKRLDLEELKLLGFGFCELIDIMSAEDFDEDLLYYQSSEHIDKEML